MKTGLESWLTHGPTPRRVESGYVDPLDLIWLNLAGELGWCVARSSDVFASWDGVKTLTLSGPEHMDRDDCLAQLIFHEVCHALVEGPEGWSKPDWGLENQDLRHLTNELACHRVQASLSAPYRLRGMLAITTDWRPHYDSLPINPMDPNPFAGPLDAPARRLAQRGLERAALAPWSGALKRALTLTQRLKALCEPCAPSGSLWRR